MKGLGPLTSERGTFKGCTFWGCDAHGWIGDGIKVCNSPIYIGPYIGHRLKGDFHPSIYIGYSGGFVGLLMFLQSL